MGSTATERRGYTIFCLAAKQRRPQSRVSSCERIRLEVERVVPNALPNEWGSAAGYLRLRRIGLPSSFATANLRSEKSIHLAANLQAIRLPLQR
jgi:hypothetical protein